MFWNKKFFPNLHKPAEVADIFAVSLQEILDENLDLGPREEFWLGPYLGHKNIAVRCAILEDQYIPARIIIGYNPDMSQFLIHDRAELDEMMRHELSHVKNGDVAGSRPGDRAAYLDYRRGIIDKEKLSALIVEAYDAQRREELEKGHDEFWLLWMKEYAADTTLCRNPEASIRYWEKSRQSSGFTVPVGWTHPSNSSRIRNLKRFAAGKPTLGPK